MSTTAATGLWTSFTAKAELLGVAVVHAASQAAAARVLQQSGENIAATASLRKVFPNVAQSLPEAAAAPATSVAAIGLYGVAETGSVALDEPRSDRGACFLADHLWLLVPESNLVLDLDEGLRRLHQLVRQGAHHPLLMSGPSRTADIERVLTIGVHGPRALTVVIVGGSE